MGFKRILLSIFLTAVVHATPVEAGSDLIYGPEWTFTAKNLMDSESAQQRYLKAVLELLLKENKKQNEFKSIEADRTHTDSIRLTMWDGTQINVGTDPGVLEVQVSPLSLKQWKKKSKIFQKYIFDVMKNVGLKPHEREGAGHVNIGLQYFDSRPELVERFIIDYLNHPGVGVVFNSLSANLEDAPSIEQYAMQNKFEFDDFEELKSDAKDSRLLPVREFKNNKHNWRSLFNYLSEKYTAIGLRGYSYVSETVLPTGRLEMRQFRPQQTMDEYVKILEMFEARIKYLEKQKGRPALETGSIKDGWVFLGQFADYIEDVGLNLKDYKSLMPKVWRDLPVKNYVRTSKNNMGAKKCANMFD